MITEYATMSDMSSTTLGIKSRNTDWRLMSDAERDKAYDAALADEVASMKSKVRRPNRGNVANRIGISRAALYTYLHDREARTCQQATATK